MKNADVTAYAFTSKFEALPPAVAIYGKSASGKAITPKNYEADEEFLFNIRTGMDWPLWRQRMGLDSIEYYKFLYPEPFYAYAEEAPEDSPSYPPMWSSTGRCRASMFCGSTNSPTISNRRSN